MIGLFGKFLVLASFVSCGACGYAYFKASRNLSLENPWNKIGSRAWIISFLFIVGTTFLIWFLIFTHRFEFHYVWSNTSRGLPNRFLFSSLWAGQEGSFLLWIIFNFLAGIGVLKWGGKMTAPVMCVIAFCQVFLISMIAGVQLGPITIGSSLFALLIDKFPDAPFLLAGGLPADGKGLNDLLQNPWMVIHPPTLFIGFASMIVPFGYAVAGLWKKQYTEWVKPALPWAIMANMILMGGIIMGGYWAYVTLSFGGYWAWDPVENSSFVPWLIGIAAIHMMIAQKRSGSSHKGALLLTIFSFMLVVYSTFLTRSGILGDVSVHSFVDLGLYNQLLAWILAMGAVGFGLFFYRLKDLPKPSKPANILSREFMMFTGASILCALGMVIIVGTSTPILGQLFRSSPSGVPLEFYNRWTLPLTAGLVFFMGIGQLFWWNKMSAKRVNEVLLRPLMASIFSTALVLGMSPFTQTWILDKSAPAVLENPEIAASIGSFLTGSSNYLPALIALLLVFFGFFALYGNMAALWKIGRGNLKLAGGAISHIGIALMIMGIIASSGFSNPIDGKFNRVGANDNKSNFVLELGETRKVEGFTVTYKGKSFTKEGYSAFDLDVVDDRGRSYSLQPVVYKSSSDQWIQHPDIKTYFEKDLYMAVGPSAMFETENNTREDAPAEIKLTQGSSILLDNGNYEVEFEKFDLGIDLTTIPMDDQVNPDDVEIAVASVLNVTQLSTGEKRTLRPIYLVMKDRSQQFIQNRIADWQASFTFAGLDISSGEIRLMVEGMSLPEADWIVVQAYEKPFINLLWFGMFIMLGGFGLSLYRRTKEWHLTLWR